MIYYVMSETKVRDDRHKISRKRGNGQLRHEVWADHHGNVTRYNLAYVNHSVYQEDNGRVLGYDNQHSHHHRHFMGKVEPFDFVSFEELEERFQREWAELSGKT
jgi:Family of unknown function (DUF6516)